MKRVFDVALTALAIVILSPLFLIVILVLRYTGEGEIFFLQSRVGLGGKPIRILKFVTMLKDSPNIGTGTITLKNDPRVLPIGKFLRKTKINELPQLFNVFKGDLSIIGPRPQTMRCFKAFQEDAQHKISLVKPGLSGIGSIMFRNEEDMIGTQADPDFFYNEVIMRFKGDLEIWYFHRHSFLVDFKLIFLTIWSIVGGDAKFAYRLFRDLPPIPKNLRYHL